MIEFNKRLKVDNCDYNLLYLLLYLHDYTIVSQSYYRWAINRYVIYVYLGNVRCVVCVFARVTTYRGLHQRRFRVLRYGSTALLRTYRVLSYGTHDPFPLTITPLLSSRLAHTSSVNSLFDRPQRWEKYTRLLYACCSRCNNEYGKV